MLVSHVFSRVPQSPLGPLLDFSSSFFVFLPSWGLGSIVWGLGSTVLGLGFRVRGLGSTVPNPKPRGLDPKPGSLTASGPEWLTIAQIWTRAPHMDCRGPETAQVVPPWGSPRALEPNPKTRKPRPRILVASFCGHHFHASKPKPQGPLAPKGPEGPLGPPRGPKGPLAPQGPEGPLGPPRGPKGPLGPGGWGGGWGS